MMNNTKKTSDHDLISGPSKPSIEIIDLYQRPECLSTVANWIYHEFWMNRPGYSPHFFESLLLKANDPSQIPLSLLATFNDHPAGIVNLVENDNEKRPDLRPWIAALYVCPEYRSFGIGSKLIMTILERAFSLKYQEIYLGTDIPEFYERLGAEFYERARSDLLIMKFKKIK